MYKQKQPFLCSQVKTEVIVTSYYLIICFLEANLHFMGFTAHQRDAVWNILVPCAEDTV